jgi:uncharacterized small protein (DUF1192 family)
VQLATRLMSEWLIATEAPSEDGPTTQIAQQEAMAQAKVSLQQIASLDLPTVMAAAEAELAAKKAELAEQIKVGEEANHRLYMENVEIGNRIKMAHAFISAREMDERIATKTAEIEAKTAELSELNAKVEALAHVAGELEAAKAELVSAQAGLAEVHAAIAKLRG